MKSFLLKLFLCLTLFILGLSRAGFAQSAVFSTYNGPALNTAQVEKLNTINAKGIYSSVSLVTYDPEAVFDSNGIVTFDVHNQLNGLPFKSFYVDYQNSDEYTWIGQFFNHDSLADNEMSMMTIGKPGTGQ